MVNVNEFVRQIWKPRPEVLATNIAVESVLSQAGLACGTVALAALRCDVNDTTFDVAASTLNPNEVCGGEDTDLSVKRSEGDRC